jgi:hypothetical protein
MEVDGELLLNRDFDYKSKRVVLDDSVLVYERAEVALVERD